ncbi:MAG TPA: hypothetical protein VN706_13165 [Gemmatimonadaceae bacterium]|nr:hypothetical protein [Gemmatimonadaceae bacterium]
MVRVSVEGDRVVFEVEGWDKVWALKSRLDIPLEHVRSVRADPEPARGWWHGVRLPGSQIPGVLTAGTFYQKDGAVFYDVHDPDNTIVIELTAARVSSRATLTLSVAKGKGSRGTPVPTEESYAALR